MSGIPRKNDYRSQTRNTPNRAPRAKIERAGHGIWLMLHMLAKKYKEAPLEFADIVRETFEEVVPCPTCRGESIEHLRENPITSDTYPPEWICNYHNRVSLKLGKLVFPCPSRFPQSYKGLKPERNREQCEQLGRLDFVDTGYYLT